MHERNEMKRAEPEEVVLRFRLSDLDDDPTEANEVLDDEDDEPEGTVSVTVERVGPDRVRLLEPCSLTPFGPIGPVLHLGDLVEVEALDDGSVRYRRVLEAALVWEFGRTGTPRAATEDAGIAAVLGEIGDAGGMWEWCAGCLWVEVPRAASDGACPPSIQALFDRLGHLLASR